MIRKLQNINYKTHNPRYINQFELTSINHLNITFTSEGLGVIDELLPHSPDLRNGSKHFNSYNLTNYGRIRTVGYKSLVTGHKCCR